MGTDRCRISVLCLMSSNRLIFLSKHEPLLPNMTTEQYIEFSEVSTIMAEATKLFLRKVSPPLLRPSPCLQMSWRSSANST